MKSREKIIVRTSIIGIAANVLLAAFKAFVGLAAHSVAIIMDAVNNLSDALSSLITIIGTKLAGRAPDKKHPLGHGRTEYLSAAIISIIVLYAGVTALVESVKKIIHPETPEYTKLSLVIVAVAVGVKIVLGLYVKRTGQRVDSDALVASGSDALFDSIISASTLVAALIFLASGVSLESWLGAVIAAFIIKSGIEMLRETLSSIIGERIPAETALAVKDAICSFEEVGGAYDLVLHNYGPERLIGSVHIEVPDTLTAHRMDELERAITRKVLQETGVIMTGISVYAVNTKDPFVQRMESDAREIAFSREHVLQLHGFYLDEPEKRVTFDVVVSYDAKNRQAVVDAIQKEMAEKYPDYTIYVTLDSDISD
ncbi:MAG: cation diffusion facilitator family transporter [Clostridia bacterium]|nr:cation diffusion facilitator family transporter [Clostridia bacterium]